MFTSPMVAETKMVACTGQFIVVSVTMVPVHRRKAMSEVGRMWQCIKSHAWSAQLGSA